MQYDAHLTVHIQNASEEAGSETTTWATWNQTGSAVTSGTDVITLKQDVLVIKIWNTVGSGSPELSGLVFFSDKARTTTVGVWNSTECWKQELFGVAANVDCYGNFWIGHNSAQPVIGAKTYYLTIHGHTTINSVPYSWAIDPELTLQTGEPPVAMKLGRQIGNLVEELVQRIEALERQQSALSQAILGTKGGETQ